MWSPNPFYRQHQNLSDRQLLGLVDDDCVESAEPVTLPILIPSYLLFDLLYLTNALSSFCNETPVNWATTIERKPDALEPSAFIPFMPKTERKEMLKIYGDAPVTVSVSIFTSCTGCVAGSFKILSEIWK